MRRKQNRSGNATDERDDETNMFCREHSILGRSVGILVLVAFFAFLVPRPSPFDTQRQHWGQNQLQSTGTSNLPLGLTPEEKRILNLPTDVLTEVLDICLYFSWKMEHKNILQPTRPFAKEHYKSNLPIPSFLVADESNANSNNNHKAKTEVNQGEETTATTTGSISKSSSTSLLRFVALRGELYPLVQPNMDYKYMDIRVKSVTIDDLDDRMLQALYVDDLLERLKYLEDHLSEQLRRYDRFGDSQAANPQLRGAREEDILVETAVSELRSYLDLSERLLSGHLDSAFSSYWSFSVADIVLYSLSNRLFHIDANPYQGHQIVPALQGKINPRDYPKIQEAVETVSRDATIRAFVQQQQSR